MSRRITGQMNVTLAAYYNKKPGHFEEFIRWCQTSVAKQIPGAFRPYELGQVHATIVGLEGMRKDGEVLNANYAKLGEARRMDLAGLLDFLSSTPLLPFQARIGGYRLGNEYSFKSLGHHPYLRSFAIQESNIVVAIGWPENDGRSPDVLDRLRKGFKQNDVIHKYHKREKDVDNDLFFVLGKVEPDVVTKVTREAVSEEIRAQIAGIEPVHIDLAREDLSLVAYINEELPLASSVQISLQSAMDDIEGVKALYMEAT